MRNVARRIGRGRNGKLFRRGRRHNIHLSSDSRKREATAEGEELPHKSRDTPIKRAPARGELSHTPQAETSGPHAATISGPSSPRLGASVETPQAVPPEPSSKTGPKGKSQSPGPVRDSESNLNPPSNQCVLEIPLLGLKAGTTIPEVNFDSLIALNQQISNWEYTFNLSAMKSNPQAFAKKKLFEFNGLLRRKLLDYTKAMFIRRQLHNALRLADDIEQSFRVILKLPWRPEEHTILEVARLKSVESRVVLATIVGCIEGTVNSWRSIGYADTSALLTQVSGYFYCT